MRLFVADKMKSNFAHVVWLAESYDMRKSKSSKGTPRRFAAAK